MISNETLDFKSPYGTIGLGWLDDRIYYDHVSEADPNFVVDTGYTPSEMKDHVYAYWANIAELYDKIVQKGGFAWQMFGKGPALWEQNVSACAATLRSWCTENGTSDQQAAQYEVKASDALANATQYTANFLISRGPYAWLGYSWSGCSSTTYPRPKEWDADYGEPAGKCTEVTGREGVFSREFSKAAVAWNCNTALGSITLKK